MPLEATVGFSIMCRCLYQDDSSHAGQNSSDGIQLKFKVIW